ncbi:MAG: sulfurtransferase [Polaromonas sp.]
MTHTTLISVQQLQALMASGQPFKVFDCSFDLGQPALGHQQFVDAHLPGALHASLDTDLSAHGGPSASGGRHPLPTQEAFAQWLTSVGMTNTTQAVVMDRNGANYCGRLWWMLKWVGHEHVAVLDGGLQAWVAAGGAVEQGEPSPAPAATAFQLAPSRYALVAPSTVADRLGRASQTVLDARGAPRFRGEVEPLDPIAGHIPGALNRPFTQNLGADGRFKAPQQLRAEFELLLGGRDPATVVHQCGSGVSAVPNLLAMEVAGLGVTALYAGSWSDWCSHTDYPVAQG